MKPEHQRIKIAEACGFLRNNELDCWKKNNRYYFNCGDSRLAQLPDYLNDRNAMVQAVKTLLKTDQQRIIFVNFLVPKTEEGPDARWFIKWQAITSDLSAISESLLKTLGLWEEEP